MRTFQPLAADLAQKINPTVANRRALRDFAREAIAEYSRLMCWLLMDDDGDLWVLEEPQGQTEYVGTDCVLATTGDFYKAHGQGAAYDAYGSKLSGVGAYLFAFLRGDYLRIFPSKK